MITAKTETAIDFSIIATALAHEIKNPAALALAHISLVRQGTSPAETMEHLNHIEEALMDITDLVQEMLFATYGESHAYEINISEVLTELCSEYRAAWPSIAITLAAPQDLSVHGQEAHIRMIFSNLLKNAIEATDENGSISIIVTKKCINSLKYLMVKIENSVDELNEWTWATKLSRNGLGLQVCRYLAARLGGRLTTINECGIFTATLQLPHHD